MSATISKEKIANEKQDTEGIKKTIGTPNRDENKGKLNEAVSLPAIQKTWKEFALECKSRGKIQEYVMLNQDITLENETIICFEMDNPVVQEALIDAIKPRLLNRLRTENRNDFLTLKIKEAVSGPSEKRLYTNKEKFEFLCEKNPKLREFIFNLDIEVH